MTHNDDDDHSFIITTTDSMIHQYQDLSGDDENKKFYKI